MGSRISSAGAKANHRRGFRTSLQVIFPAVMINARFQLSLGNVRDLLHEREIDVSHETVQF